MKLVIGSDHGGYELKEIIKKHLKDHYEIEDVGTHSLESCDYPIYARKVAEIVVKENILGIAICTSGIGVSIVANKVIGARAALVTNKEQAHLSREHNNANVLCLGASNQSVEDAIEFVDIWLNSSFSNGERHIRRVNLIEKR